MTSSNWFDLSDGGKYPWLNYGRELTESCDTCGEAFVAQLKNADYVSSVFFSGGCSHVTVPNQSFLNNISASLVSDSIAHTSLYGFNSTVDSNKCNIQWNGNMGNNDGLTYCRDLFYIVYNPNTDENTLKLSMSYLAETTSSPQWINGVILYLSTGKVQNWEWKLQIILFDLLNWGSYDCSLFDRVNKAWKNTFPSNYQVNVSCFNDSISLIGGPISQSIINQQLSNDMFISEVNNAIQVCNMWYDPSSMQILHYDYGINVENWINNNSYGSKYYGLTTGQRASNHTVQNAESFGCFKRNSKITLFNGKEINIQNIQSHMKIISQYGLSSEVSDEKVIVYPNIKSEKESDHYHHVFGFNDEEPFFTSCHPFWTSDGIYKAINPELSLKENPHLRIKQLKIGDVVYKIKQINDDHTNPYSNSNYIKQQKMIEYEEIKIYNFTIQRLNQNEPVYGIHLHGEPSYHVNGYLVLMNYPEITGRRIAKGIQSQLSKEEKIKFIRNIEENIPILSKGLGNFVTQPLNDVLKESKEDKNIEEVIKKLDKNIELYYDENGNINIKTNPDKLTRVQYLKNWKYNIKSRKMNKDNNKYEFYQSRKELLNITFDCGHLIINNEHVCIIDQENSSNCISFNMNKYKGTLYLSKDRHLIRGNIDILKSEQELKHEEEEEKKNKLKLPLQEDIKKENEIEEDDDDEIISLPSTSTSSLYCQYQILGAITNDYYLKITNSSFSDNNIDTMRTAGKNLYDYSIMRYGVTWNDDNSGDTIYGRTLKFYDCSLTENEINDNTEPLLIIGETQFEVDIDNNGLLNININALSNATQPVSDWIHQPLLGTIIFNDTLTSVDGYLTIYNHNKPNHWYYTQGYNISPTYNQLYSNFINYDNFNPINKLSLQKNEEKKYEIDEEDEKTTYQESKNIKKPSLSYQYLTIPSKSKKFGASTMKIKQMNNIVYDDPLIMKPNSLSLDDLKGINADPVDINNAAMNILMTNAKYIMPPDWLSEFFGESLKEPPDDVDAVNAASDFYLNFSRCIIGNMIDTQIDYLSPENKRRLQYFLNTGIAQDNVYNSEMSRIYVSAFIRCASAINAYIQDSGSTNWAPQLYSSCVHNTDTFNSMISEITVDHSYSLVNHYSTLLNALGRMDLSNQLNQVTMIGTLNNTAITQVIPISDPSYFEYMTDYYRQFIVDNKNNTPTNQDEKDVQQMAQTLDESLNDLVTQGKMTYGDAFTQLVSDTLQAVIVGFSQDYGDIISKFTTIGDMIISKFPKLKQVGSTASKLFGSLATVGCKLGIMTILGLDFKNYKNLSIADQTMLIVNAVALGAELAVKAGQFLANEWTDFACSQSAKMADEAGSEMFGVLFSENKSSLRWYKEYRGLAYSTLEGVMPRFSKFFQYASKVAEFLGVAASGCMAAVSMYNFIEAIKKGDVNTIGLALMGVQAVASLCEFGFAAAGWVCGLLGLTELCTILSFCATIFAILGVLAMFLYMIFGKPKVDPDQWQKDWIDQNLMKFLDSSACDIPDGYVDLSVTNALQWYAKQSSSDTITWTYTYTFNVITSTIDDHTFTYEVISQFQESTQDPLLGNTINNDQFYHLKLQELQTKNSDNQWISNYSVLEDLTPNEWADVSLTFDQNHLPTYFTAIQEQGTGILYWIDNGHNINHGELIPSLGGATNSGCIVNNADISSAIGVYQHTNQGGPDRLVWINQAGNALQCGTVKITPDGYGNIQSTTLDNISNIYFADPQTGINGNITLFSIFLVYETNTQYIVWQDNDRINAGKTRLCLSEIVEVDNKETDNYCFDCNIYKSHYSSSSDVTYDGDAYSDVCLLYMSADQTSVWLTWRSDDTTTNWQTLEFCEDEYVVNAQVVTGTQNINFQIHLAGDPQNHAPPSVPYPAWLPWKGIVTVNYDFNNYSGYMLDTQNRYHGWNGKNKSKPPDTTTLKNLQINNDNLYIIKSNMSNECFDILNASWILDQTTAIATYYIVWKEKNTNIIYSQNLDMNQFTFIGNASPLNVPNYTQFYGCDQQFEYIVTNDYGVQVRVRFPVVNHNNNNDDDTGTGSSSF